MIELRARYESRHQGISSINIAMRDGKNRLRCYPQPLETFCGFATKIASAVKTYKSMHLCNKFQMLMP